jgi:hypothetical protein
LYGTFAFFGGTFYGKGYEVVIVFFIYVNNLSSFIDCYLDEGIRVNAEAVILSVTIRK